MRGKLSRSGRLSARAAFAWPAHKYPAGAGLPVYLSWNPSGQRESPGALIFTFSTFPAQ